MPRLLKVAAAQVGAVNRTDSREATLDRIIKLVESAAEQGVKLVVLPELALTTFFARYVGLDADPVEFDKWFEEGEITGSKNVARLFARAKELNIAICLGYAEKTSEGEHYNSCSYVAASGEEISKIHLPGTVEPFTNPGAINQLEKRFFLPGNLGFKGVELVLCGYNTVNWAPELFGHPRDMPVADMEARAIFQHLLVMQAHSYTNACFSISAARAGYDDGAFGMIGASAIVHPEGHILAQSKGLGDELVIAEIDLDDVNLPKEKIFAFEKHRRPEHYTIITAQAGVTEPK
ncbi:hypothetical protein RQP46_009864 [Phenoliferia psychrophenolica]